MNIIGNQYKYIKSGYKRALELDSQLKVFIEGAIDRVSSPSEEVRKKWRSNYANQLITWRNQKRELLIIFLNKKKEWNIFLEKCKGQLFDEIENWEANIHKTRSVIYIYVSIMAAILLIGIVLSLFYFIGTILSHDIFANNVADNLELFCCCAILIPFYFIAFIIEIISFIKLQTIYHIYNYNNNKPDLITIINNYKLVELGLEEPKEPDYPSKPDNPFILSVPTLGEFDTVNKSWFHRISKIAEQPGYTEYGQEGEFLLVKELSEIDIEAFCLRNLLVEKNLDVDALYICERGIFILESKYWNGIISAKDGDWECIQDNYYCYNNKSFNNVEEQWMRQKQSIQRIISRKYPTTITAIQGGVVFTHDKSELGNISTNIEYGTIFTWKNRILESPKNADYSTETTLGIIDLLLFEQERLSRIELLSSVDLADTIYKEVEQRSKEKFSIFPGGDNT